MKFLFVSKPMKYEHLGFMYISSVLKAAGIETRLYIISSDLKQIIDWQPDFIGCSVMTGSQNYYFDFLRMLKTKMDFLSVVGGPHATYFPDIAKESCVDYACQGEGEKGILKILQKPKEKVILAPLIENLDSIAFPDRAILYQDKYHYYNPIKHFTASRGCPYSCPYCYNSSNVKLYKGQKWFRFRSVANVIDEIKEVVARYPTKFVYFQDDNFIMDKQWVIRFCKLYKKEIRKPFHCVVRLDLLDEEIVSNLSQASCVCVRCAIENGNDYIREKILNRRMTKVQIEKGVSLLRKYKIAFLLQNILGLPQAGLREDLETLDLNIRCRPTLGWSSIFQPYPGTKLGEMFPQISINDINDNFYDNSVLSISQKKQRLRLQKLFGLITHFSFLRPFLPILLNLKLDNLYKKLWQWNNKRADKIIYRGILK
jgi:radical SAM superfamily enzyme YgiQ (UPF0313 family)